MQEVVIVPATRTTAGSFQGSLAGIATPELYVAVIRRLLEKPGLPHAVPTLTLNKVCGSDLTALHLDA